MYIFCSYYQFYDNVPKPITVRFLTSRKLFCCCCKYEVKGPGNDFPNNYILIKYWQTKSRATMWLRYQSWTLEAEDLWSCRTLWSPDIVKLLLAANISKQIILCFTTYLEWILVCFSSENTGKEALSTFGGKFRKDSEHKLYKVV